MDTVHDYNPHDDWGTGWTFSPFHADSFKSSLWFALETYWNHRDSFKGVGLLFMKEVRTFMLKLTDRFVV